MYSCDSTDRSRNSVMDSPQWGQVVSAVVSSMAVSLADATESFDYSVNALLIQSTLALGSPVVMAITSKRAG
jgi:hypothetical protein